MYVRDAFAVVLSEGGRNRGGCQGRRVSREDVKVVVSEVGSEKGEAMNERVSVCVCSGT